MLVLTTRSWPAIGGIEFDATETARYLAKERPVRMGALVNDDREMTRSLQYTEVPAFAPFDAGGFEVHSIPAGSLARARLLALRFWRGRLPHQLYHGARALSGPVYAGALAPGIERLAQGMSLIHLFGADVLGLAALRAARRLGIPLVMSPYAHDDWWGSDPLNRSLYRKADAIVSLLETDAAWYRNWGVPPGRVHTVGVYRNTGEAGDLPAEIRSGAPMVLFLGIKRPYKGHHLLREAAPLVWERHPDAVFVLAGPGDEAAGPSTDPRIIDIDRVTEPQKFALIQRCDILCLPSRSEILPGVILEAWHMGKPVVTSNIATLTELVGQGGEVCTPDALSLASAVSSLLGDADRRARMGEWGRRQVAEKYNREAVSQKLEEVYRAVLGRATL
ncbi:MAG: phosphatidyl-myo-inositol dimannoside synthase [Chloroflexota bacterium]|nr:phosphatidyl-myo-inositol dimannoside synthase [Chloroflexota bacterium]